MMKAFKRTPIFSGGIAFLFFFFFTACEKADTNTTIKNPSTLQLYLTDSPIDYAAVWIDIQQVMVHLRGDTTGQSGWQELPVLHPGRYNLLNHRNGQDTLLVSSEVPAGKLTEVKLLIGKDNTIDFKNGQSTKLLVPSGKQHEINLQVENVSLQPNTTFELVLDFDLAHSIQEPSRPDSGQYLLNPVIRLFARGAAASIEGWVIPEEAHAQVRAISLFQDTLTAVPDSSSGFFKFWGIPEGNYSLYFMADSTSGYANDTLINIQAVHQERVKTDTVVLHKKSTSSESDSVE